MPGRQSTAPLSLQSNSVKSRNSKRKKQRSLNALAIAEKTHPEQVKIRKHRIGESGPGYNSKRKREISQESDPSDDDDGAALGSHPRPKRKKLSGHHGDQVDYGSDSEGNEWMLGGVGSEDDESIDSDHAMPESDEEKFEGFVFRGSSSRQNGRKRIETRGNQENQGLIELNENASDHEIDDDFGGEGIDMAAVLDTGTDDEDVQDEDEYNGFSPRRSEDEKLVDEAPDAKSDTPLSEDENDVQDAVKLASLKSLAAALNGGDEQTSSVPGAQDAHESMVPSEYGLKAKQKLTVADLLPSITDPQLKRSLGILADDGRKSSSKHTGVVGKLEVPLPKRQQDRLDRAAAYEKSKDTLNRWIDTVKHNRRADHLSFPLQDQGTINARAGNKLNRHTKPLTDMEATIQSILQDSGLASNNGKSGDQQLQAFEELEANKIPFEEVQARRADLRRARDLLFREEIRAKRINKIKSKSYRRIHRKERERLVQKDKEALAAAGVEDSESEKEKNARRRAEERMGAKHRESRWAKRVKDSGRMRWDEDARGGFEEMARREEDLRRRMLGRDVGSDSDESTDEAAEDLEGDKLDGDRASRKLHHQMQSLQDESNRPSDGTRDRTSALASMRFMRDAEAAQKASNEEAVQRMQRDLAGEETPSEAEPEESSGRRSYGPTRNASEAKKPLRPERHNEFEEGKASEDEGEDRTTGPVEEEVQIIVDGTHAVKSTNGRADGGAPQAGKQRRSQQTGFSTQPAGIVEENPWLSGGKPKSNGRDKKFQDPHAVAIISNQLPSAQVKAAPSKVMTKAAMISSKKPMAQPSSPMPMLPPDDGASDEEAEGAEEHRGAGFVFRNQDLVRRAFAGDDVVGNFEKEKEDTMQSEDEKIIDNALAGWGSWTGLGIGKKTQRGNKNRFLSKQEGVPKAKRQDAKLNKVIINEKRVKKNTKYLASQLPHPFETRQQYERSLRLPVGPEWTTKETFQAATKPRVLLKQGIIAPMAKPMI
ncbi:MAG: hypothetical protein Q9174_002889 [Haloplaca sp. 1 TL-2023]